MASLARAFPSPFTSKSRLTIFEPLQRRREVLSRRQMLKIAGCFVIRWLGSTWVNPGLRCFDGISFNVFLTRGLHRVMFLFCLEYLHLCYIC